MKFSDSFHLLAKPIGPICNLDCTYCFYLEKEKLFPDSKDWKMSDEVLDNFIRQYIEVQTVPEINFGWQGGEPTMLGVDYFRRVIEIQNKYADGKKINNSLQTNGVLLNDEWADFFAKNNFLIGLSVDGPAELHDYYRVHKNKKPTFDEVMNGLEFLKKHGVEFNTLTCINRINAYKPLEVYNFLKEIGSVYMQFIPIVERKASAVTNDSLELISPDYSGDSELADWSVESLQYGKFLNAVFDEWIRNDVGKQFVQIFEVALESWFGKTQSLCVFNKTCGRAMAIEHNGDIYSCDHFVYPENRLGNIMEASLASLVDSPQEIKFGMDKADKLPKYCLQCDVRFACNGECPKHRFIKTPEGEEGLNYLCEGYKNFFHYINPYMKIMANELHNRRSPAIVMEWAREKDAGFPSFNTGRNEDCPCGSGSKFKSCCMKKRK
ncbi:MAG TPA: anaerobic sulfatase-maturation protein [Melioribacteraceae bacterium]|nr:anaerobic sulfatase-maturation protein [Melioribacteraceae bacterium]